ncbi:hypothetical protein TZ90_00105 [Streptococcus mitis]|uniref:Uncharacterized protein n=1 Tax=Streptococcus mitis TaxID=28037 RepID=A0A0F2DEU8_STRMT|nr:sigma-70 family RNA polymerase sigma factor [Streptococcus mitis]KJQ69428.1 hypothetical protein TZ90_00105 [Streptococcus mitis]
MTNKVEDKRERKIANAVKSDNWSEVDKLLSQAMDNLERKERYYGVTSLDAVLSNKGRNIELIDLYPDNTYNPIEHLLIKERNELLFNALSKLPEEELHILLEIVLHGTSATQLTKETSFKSHKTIQKHYEATLNFLNEELGKYF